MDKEALFISKKENLLSWKAHYRIIPSQFPPSNFFERIISPDLMEEVFYIESLTNDRLRDEIGNLHLVAKDDRITGPGASWVMAAFTHPTAEGSRFSPGSFGVYYASKTLATAINETVYHTEIFLNYTKEPKGIYTKRVLKGTQILKPLIDIRGGYTDLHDPENTTASRIFGEHAKSYYAWGIVYDSVRHKNGECIAIFRPNAIALPIIQTQHLQYFWDGHKITEVVALDNAIA